MIKSVGVVGAGTMGHGIAMHFAQKGIPTILCDVSEQALQTAKEKIDQHVRLFREEGYKQEYDISNYLEFTTNLYDLSETDFITECVSEDLGIKQTIFEQLDQICKREAYLVSNTSSLKLSDILKNVTQHRENSMLTHWFNPPHLVPLVELLRTEDTSARTFSMIKKFLEDHDKQTIEVKKEVPGLVANRIQVAMAREVLTLLEEGVAEPEDLDIAITGGPGFRLSISGLLEIMDFGGIDIWQKVMTQLQPEIASHTSTYRSVTEKVEKEDYGVKSGRGFYEYPDRNFDNYILERDRKLLKQLMNINKLT